jgi:hypothetical protein
MARTPISQIRQHIMERKGMVSSQAHIGAPSRHRPKAKPLEPGRKTHFMEYLEMKYGNGQSIWDMLQTGSLSVICKRLGNEVDPSTVSKWLKRFKLRYSASNLPSCADCLHHRPACDLGTCTILIKLELWELALLKQKQIQEVQ